jgi:hypothetical protein
MEILPENHEILGCFHDAIVKGFGFEHTVNGVRSIALALEVNQECGMPNLIGEMCILRFQNPSYLTGDFIFICDGWDQISGIDFTDDSNFAVQVKRGVAMGLPVPKLYLTVGLTSGSIFNICCERLVVEAVSGI